MNLKHCNEYKCRIARICSALALLLTVAIAPGLAGCTSLGTHSGDSPALAIDSVRVTAAGHYIDLRYRVLDPVRANQALGPGVKPKMIDESSGAIMAVPTTAKLGSLRQTQAEQRPNRTYFVLFVNSAGIRPGSVVTAQLGDFEFKHLKVE